MASTGIPPLPSQCIEDRLGIDHELDLFKVGKIADPPVLSSFDEQRHFLDAIAEWGDDPGLKSRAQYLGQLSNNFDIAWEDITEAVNNGDITRAPSVLVEEFIDKYQATPAQYRAKKADLASRLFITTQFVTIRSYDEFDRTQAELMRCKNGHGANSLFTRFKVRLLQTAIDSFVDESTVIDMDDVIARIPKEIQKSNGWTGNIPRITLPLIEEAKAKANISHKPQEKKSPKRSSVEITGAPIERSFKPTFASRPNMLRKLQNVDEWNDFSREYSEEIEMPANELALVEDDTIRLNDEILKLNAEEIKVLNMLMLSYGSNAFSFVQARQHHRYEFPTNEHDRVRAEKVLQRTLLRFKVIGLIGYNDPENHRGIFLLPTIIL